MSNVRASNCGPQSGAWDSCGPMHARLPTLGGGSFRFTRRRIYMLRDSGPVLPTADGDKAGYIRALDEGTTTDARVTMVYRRQLAAPR